MKREREIEILSQALLSCGFEVNENLQETLRRGMKKIRQEKFRCRKYAKFQHWKDTKTNELLSDQEEG